MYELVGKVELLSDHLYRKQSRKSVICSTLAIRLLDLPPLPSVGAGVSC